LNVFQIAIDGIDCDGLDLHKYLAYLGRWTRSLFKLQLFQATKVMHTIARVVRVDIFSSPSSFRKAPQSQPVPLKERSPEALFYRASQATRSMPSPLFFPLSLQIISLIFLK
jgi:hypothetical protein